MIRQPALFVWFAYVLSIPFYVVAGGYPQPGDALIVLIVPLAIRGWRGRMTPRTRRTVRYLVWFTVWVTVVDLVWAAIVWHAGQNLLFPLYYIYNLLLLISAIALHQRYGDGFVRVTVHAVYILVAFQVLASLVMRARWGARATLFFQNPNQLGYYALLAACVIALTQRRAGIGQLKASIGMIACGYLGVISASRSSVAGIALLTALLLFSNPRILVVSTIVAAALIVVGAPVDSSFDVLQDRISENRQANLTFWEQRGYDRIWNNKEDLVLGAGEGSYWRFADSTAIGGAEIHSSAGTVVFSYGIVGTYLFIAFCLSLIRGVRVRTALILLPPLSYTIAHQGLRFSMLWVLLALFLALNHATAKKPAAVVARPLEPGVISA